MIFCKERENVKVDLDALTGVPCGEHISCAVLAPILGPVHWRFQSGKEFSETRQSNILRASAVGVLVMLVERFPP